MRTGLALVLALAVPATAVSSAGSQPNGAVAVTVTLAGGAAPLPADTVLDATLEDVSRADAAAIVLGHARADWSGAPLRLTIGYDAAQIVAGGRYAVRARLSRGDALLYISDTQRPVLTHGASDSVALQLVPVAPDKPAAPAATTPLTGTLWVLTSLDDRPAPRNVTPRAAHLQFDAQTQQASGSGGCNRFSGGYTQSGARLRVEVLAATKMACLNDSGALEPAFFKALADSRRWQINGSELVLLDARGRARLRFRGAMVLR
jgi:putative lipoprotein